MGIIIGKNTRVVVQGITGTQGSFHTERMLEYGTNIVAGTSPGKGGTKFRDIPVYDTFEEAQEKHKANASIIFIPAPFAADAAFEAIENGIKTVVIITEHIPIKDAISLMAYARQNGVTVVGQIGR